MIMAVGRCLVFGFLDTWVLMFDASYMWPSGWWSAFVAVGLT